MVGRAGPGVHVGFAAGGPEVGDGLMLCEILMCPVPASETVEHPQRGEMKVCKYHRVLIETLLEVDDRDR